MTNPLIQLGTLSRLRASVILDEAPELNVTASFLAQEGISMTLEDNATDIYKTMTGTVTSPQPYRMVTVMAHLLRTQFLATAWKNRELSNSVIGAATVRTDSNTLGTYDLLNCAITQVGELVLNGQNVGYGVSFQGYWPINSQLWTDGL